MHEKNRLVYERFKNQLKPDKKGKGYICPICGSGTGKNGTGISENPKSLYHYTCWRGCFKNADAFDIIAIKEGLQIRSKEAMEKTYSLYSGDISVQSSEMPHNGFLSARGSHYIGDRLKTSYSSSEGKLEYCEINFTDKIKTCADSFKNSPAENYLKARGISSKTAEKFFIGYSKDEYFSDGKKYQAIILPVNKSFYIARNIENGERYNIAKGSTIDIFNISTVSEQRPIFITEGIFDALSIIEVGGLAIALNGIGNINKLVNYLKNSKNIPPLILALDLDDAGRKASQDLKDKCSNINFIDGLFILCGMKDANEALINDRNKFMNTVLQIQQQAMDIINLEQNEYLSLNSASFLDSFIDNLNKKSKFNLKSGFNNLDSALNGGLYSGLYFIGAVSSLGKTTFCLQIADQVALSGQDVIIFSLEMARSELIAKSISRLTFINAQKKNLDTRYAKATRNLTSYYTEDEKFLVEQSISDYRNQIAPNIWIFEGIGNLGVEDIKSSIEKHIHFTGKKPFVLIDYVQILAPYDIRATDKQNTDKAVLELKRISRDFDIPILCISSLNRESYTEPVSMRSFKESGAIEYGSDVLLGIQYMGIEYQNGETDKNRQIRVRELIKNNEIKASEGKSINIELKILKNRNGKKGLSIPMSYYPMFNIFIEDYSSVYVDKYNDIL